MRSVNYSPSTIRSWHDGPVIVLDCEGVGVAIDTRGATYVVIYSIADAATYLNTLSRPFAGTIYVIAPAEQVKMLSHQFSDLDVVHLIV